MSSRTLIILCLLVIIQCLNTTPAAAQKVKRATAPNPATEAKPDKAAVNGEAVNNGAKPNTSPTPVTASPNRTQRSNWNSEQVRIYALELDPDTDAVVIHGSQFGEGPLFRGTITVFVPEQGDLPLDVIDFDPLDQEIIAMLPPGLSDEPGVYKLTIRTKVSNDGSDSIMLGINASRNKSAASSTQLSQTAGSKNKLAHYSQSSLQDKLAQTAGRESTRLKTAQYSQHQDASPEAIVVDIQCNRDEQAFATAFSCAAEVAGSNDSYDYDWSSGHRTVNAAYLLRCGEETLAEVNVTSPGGAHGSASQVLSAGSCSSQAEVD